MNLKKVVCTILVIIAGLYIPVNVLAISSTGAARCLYFSDPGIGMTASINSRLNGVGYTSTMQANVSKTTMDNTLSGISKVVYINTHGNQNSSWLKCSNGYLYPADVTSSSISFVYLEACYSSVHTTGVTSFRQKMQNLGVPMTVGFMGSISYTSQSDGINYFSDRVFYYLANGYQLNAAIISARNNLYSLGGGYWGSDLIEYTGVFNTLP